MPSANFYSAGDFHSPGLVFNTIKGRLPMTGKGNFYSNYVHLDEAGNAMVFALNNFQGIKGGIVNVADYNPILYSDMIKMSYAIGGKKKPPSNDSC